MNLGQIKTAVYRFGFNSTDPVVDWVNEALTNFVDAYRWPFLDAVVGVSLTVGVPTVSGLPTDLGPIRALHYVDPQTFAHVSIPYRDTSILMDDGYNNTAPFVASGKPEYWTYVYPPNVPTVNRPPDVSYAALLYYSKTPAILSGDSDVPDIPTRYHYALVRGAASIGLEAENQEERASNQAQRFQDIIDRAITRYSVAQTGRFSTIRNVRD